MGDFFYGEQDKYNNPDTYPPEYAVNKMEFYQFFQDFRNQNNCKKCRRHNSRCSGKCAFLPEKLVPDKNRHVRGNNPGYTLPERIKFTQFIIGCPASFFI